MALSNAQRADAIVRYLNANTEPFQEFLLDEFNINTLVDFNVDPDDKKRRVIAITTLDAGGGP
jgi:hypothetical protein